MRERFMRSDFVRLTVLCAILVSCATNPYTDRWQLEMLPQSYMNKMGAQAYSQVKSDPKVQISNNPRETEPVQRVAKNIIQAAKVSKYAETAKTFDWEVTVIK